MGLSHELKRPLTGKRQVLSSLPKTKQTEGEVCMCVCVEEMQVCVVIYEQSHVITKWGCISLIFLTFSTVVICNVLFHK